MYPVLFKIGSFPIRSWGVLVATGFLISLLFAKYRANEKGLKSDLIYDFALYLLIFGIIGARLAFVLGEIGFFLKNPLQILYINQGGMSIYGALTGGFLVAIFFAKRHKISLLQLGDVVAPSILIGQAIGRVGCFFNGCCYGKVTNFFLAVKFPGIKGLRYPTQLFEAVFDLIAFALLWRYRNRFKNKGVMFLTVVLIYSAIRFFDEIFRGDMAILFWKITWGEFASLFIALIAIIFIFLLPKITKTD